MILFVAAGFAADHFWNKQWAVPVAVLAGLLVAPMVPVPSRQSEPGDD